MSNITLKEDELEAILAEVERDLAAVLKSESQRLSKAVGDEEEGKEEEAPEAPAAEDAPSEMSAEASPGDAPAPEGSAPEAAAAIGADDADKQPDPEGEDPAEDKGGDMEALKGEYAQLSMDELKMHYLAAKSALLEQMKSSGEDEKAPEAEEPAADAPPAPPAPAAEGSASPAAKSEGAAKANLAKAEDQKTQKIAELQAQVSGLAKAVELLISTPQRKAVTSIAYLGKAEEAAEKPTFTKSEITQKLGEKAKDRSLSKSDRNLINKFCVGEVGVKEIEHLLR